MANMVTQRENLNRVSFGKASGPLDRLFICTNDSGSADLGFAKATFVRRLRANRQCSGCQHHNAAVRCFAAFITRREQGDKAVDTAWRLKNALEPRQNGFEKRLDFFLRRFANWLSEEIRLRVKRPQVACDQTISGGSRDLVLAQEARPLPAAARLHKQFLHFR